ncbi:MAG: formyl-CoA transferase [Deltaproteobacteria bacterium]|nr:formyl-CoA transferase [Deltaproteobacteria bacterium]
MPALDGLRILDMTQYEAGTSCTQMLGWLGADVVKIEAPRHGDPGRTLVVGGDYAPYFCNWNTNKRSLALDLAKPEGRELLLRLVPRFDIFIENYGPGVVERLDLEYETLKALHPGLIYAQIKGFGSSGPYADFKSYDMIAQAAAGAFSVTGDFDGPPMLPGPTTADSGTGVQMAVALLAAVVQRHRTGRGQHIEISMQEAMTYYMRTRTAFASDFGAQAVPRIGNAMGAAPTGLYACKPFGPNDHAYLITVTNRHWDHLCMAMERLDLLVDPRFEAPEGRVENGEALREEIGAWTAERTKYEVMETLAKAGVPCSAILDTKDLHEDPHLLARGFIEKVEHPERGEVRLLGCAPRMSESPVEMQRAPLLGEHSEEVLRAELDLQADQLAALRASGVVGQREPG